jgi:UDP-N-acetylglucosamine 1-carboxyvinyltransferase
MDSFVVRGLGGVAGLSGEVMVGGAKNAALPIMAASLLVEGEAKLSNVPDIADVRSMITLVEKLGGFTTFKDGVLSIRPKDADGTVIDDEIGKRMRASILLVAAVLARAGTVTFPHPGGCVLGSRPIDVFVEGFKALGAEFTETGETYTLSAPKGLSGGTIFFRVMSVTGTEALMIAATRATAPITLHNCAMEPEVVAAAEFLNASGARIAGAGTPTITIVPTSLQSPVSSFQIIPDRIEAGSFLILGALAGNPPAGGITIRGADPAHLASVTETLRDMGVMVEIQKDVIRVNRPETLRPAEVRTHEYPGFPTDLQAPMSVLQTQADGESSILETVFDARLNYAAELVRMGADMSVVNPHKAIIKGPTPLKARDIMGPDIRAGLAFLLAAAIAEGDSTIGNAHLIDRGYEKIEEKLSALGLLIKRVSA